MYLFGSGVLIGTPSGANPTPVNLGLVQEVTYDESTSLKSLYGQNRRALAVGAGTIKSSVKAKSARISGLAIASLYYGVTPTPGQKGSVMGEAGTVPGASTYIITVANSVNWTQDQGVIYAGSGLPLTRVASAPAIGQYSVSAGVYTFAAADANAKMLLSYNYTISASGQSFAINNPLLGATVSFGLNLYGIDPTNGNGMTLRLYNCVMSKFSFGTKLEDFTMPDFEAECFANGAGLVGDWNLPDIF